MAEQQLISTYDHGLTLFITITIPVLSDPAVLQCYSRTYFLQAVPEPNTKGLLVPCACGQILYPRETDLRQQMRLSEGDFTLTVISKLFWERPDISAKRDTI